MDNLKEQTRKLRKLLKKNKSITKIEIENLGYINAEASLRNNAKALGIEVYRIGVQEWQIGGTKPKNIYTHNIDKTKVQKPRVRRTFNGTCSVCKKNVYFFTHAYTRGPDRLMFYICDSCIEKMLS